MRDPGSRVGPGDPVTQNEGGPAEAIEREGTGPAASPAARDRVSGGARPYERPALLAGLIATTIGIVVLVGWAAGLEPLRAFLPGTLPMKANAALLLALSGTALILQGSGRRARVEDALAIAALGVAAATGLEFATGVDLGIDRLLASDVAQPGAPYAGRMALGAVIGFAAMGLGLLALGRSWRGWHPSAFLALLVGLIGGLGILGYLYGASELTSIGSVTQIAFPAAVGFTILAAGLVAADPAHGLMRLFRDPGLAGQLTRRLVPTIVLVLPIAGWLEIGLVQAGILDERVGVAAMVCLDILILGSVGIWIAGGVERLERARVAARREHDGVERRTDALAVANVELEAFSYSVSHDLRAPLRSIDAFSQILLNEYAAPLDSEGRRILGIVLRNVKQMGVLIDDLLAFSRVSRVALEHRPVDMARLAEGVAEELRAASPEREIAFDMGPLDDVPGDVALLRQVWANLLGNAFKFSGPIEHARVDVRSERADGECRYTVRDNGVGFDPAYLDKLFAPFSRLHSTADFEGTGIGLAIVARIVARHGGRVWAEGEPGEGALFGFSIPADEEAA